MNAESILKEMSFSTSPYQKYKLMVIVMSCFEVEVKDGNVWIVDNSAHHIDGEPFKYRQIDECRANMLCDVLNVLYECCIHGKEVVSKLHDIKYSNANYTLDDILELV